MSTTTLFSLSMSACTSDEPEAAATTTTTPTEITTSTAPARILDVGTELDLQAGQCWGELPTPQPPTTGPQARTVAIVDCAAAHIGKVYGNGCLGIERAETSATNKVVAIPCPGNPDDPWPTQRDIEPVVAAACLPLFEDGVGERYATSDLEAIELVPTEEMWLAGERRYVCTAQDPPPAE